MSGAGPRGGSALPLLEAPAPRTKEPDVERDTDVGEEEMLAPLWRVICHDDPVTTMDFVVEVLMEVFRLPTARAFALMMRVHHTGAAVIGRWPESVAKARAERGRAKARGAGFPLAFTVERDG